jgi:hypothetical protein
MSRDVLHKCRAFISRKDLSASYNTIDSYVSSQVIQIRSDCQRGRSVLTTEFTHAHAHPRRVCFVWKAAEPRGRPQPIQALSSLSTALPCLPRDALHGVEAGQQSSQTNTLLATVGRQFDRRVEGIDRAHQGAQRRAQRACVHEAAQENTLLSNGQHYIDIAIRRAWLAWSSVASLGSPKCSCPGCRRGRGASGLLGAERCGWRRQNSSRHR